VKVRRFEDRDRAPIARLNQRLSAANVVEVVYPEGDEQRRDAVIRERLFVAEDGDEIRGGVWLKEQNFRIGGEDLSCGWLKYPVAESLIDPRFSGIPGSLIIQCLREQPRLMALGLGGHATPLARILKALKWTGISVPMLVRFVRPGRSLRELAPMRSGRGRRVAAAVLGGSGLAWLGVQLWNAIARIRGGKRDDSYAAEPCDALGAWADDVWLAARDAYDLIAARDLETAEAMTPRSPDVQRLRVRRHGKDVGWAVVLRHDFSVGAPDPNFGRLKVCLIADCMAAPEHARGVMSATLDVLLHGDVDLVFSNQLHGTWVAALRALGFVTVPSNFAFYASPRALPAGTDLGRCHINRGDCDGPLWYDG
jgi:hypothetical protein